MAADSVADARQTQGRAGLPRGRGLG